MRDVRERAWRKRKGWNLAMQRSPEARLGLRAHRRGQWRDILEFKWPSPRTKAGRRRSREMKIARP